MVIDRNPLIPNIKAPINRNDFIISANMKSYAPIKLQFNDKRMNCTLKAVDR